MVGMHLKHAADALAIFLRRIQNARTRGEHARIDTAEGERTDEGIVHDLEGENREGLIVGSTARIGLFRLRVDTLHALDFERRREEVHNRVEHGLHALVLERAATQHRHELAGDGAFADELLESRLVGLIALEIGLHDSVVHFDRELDELGAILVRLILQVVADVAILEFGAEGFILPDDFLHHHEVDETFELGLRADRQLNHERHRPETGHDHVDAAIEVRAHAVHLVDEAHARNAVLVSLAPHGFGLGLNAGNRVEHSHGTVEHTERTFNFNREVHVAGRVDDVDALVFPEARRRGGGDRDATLLLLLHPVHGSSAVVHFADLMAHARIEQDALGRRRLTGIDVSHDADIAVIFELRFA